MYLHLAFVDLSGVPIWAPVAAAAVAMAALIIIGLSGYDSSNTVEGLDLLEDYEVTTVKSDREKSLEKSALERVFMSVGSVFGKLIRRVTPVGYVNSLKEKMLLTGKATNDEIERFLALRVITGVLAVPMFFFGTTIANGGLGLMAGGFLALACILGPDSMLNRKVEERQMAIRQSLPDLLDLLTISVEAGLGFEQALQRAVVQVPGPLSLEFQRMLAELRTGSTRADSLRAVDRRCGVEEVRSFVLAILQADAFGVSIARVLRVQAEEMRIKRRQLAQEKAQKAPVKMLIPMVFCVFPAVFVVIIGPAMINLRESL
jgi:tight adherence protein C